MESTLQASELVNLLINVILIPILPVLTAYVSAYIRKKTQEIENSIQNKEFSKYLNLAENAVITSVTAVNQVYVDALKKSNGSLSPYEQKVAFEMAREKVLKIIGTSTLEAIKVLFNDFESWLEERIEFYVSLSKKNPELLKTDSFRF